MNTQKLICGALMLVLNVWFVVMVAVSMYWLAQREYNAGAAGEGLLLIFQPRALFVEVPALLLIGATYLVGMGALCWLWRRAE